MNLVIKEVKELSALLQWRREVIEHVFGEAPSAALMERNRDYYRRHITDRSHIAIEAECDGRGAGCGSICLTEELPSPDNPSGRCAYLMNIYVREEYRRRGVAAEIVRWLVEKARKLGCDKIYLETTGMARPLYERAGFKELPAMMKYENTDNRKS